MDVRPYTVTVELVRKVKQLLAEGVAQNEVARRPDVGLSRGTVARIAHGEYDAFVADPERLGRKRGKRVRPTDLALLPGVCVECGYFGFLEDDGVCVACHATNADTPGFRAAPLPALDDNGLLGLDLPKDADTQRRYREARRSAEFRREHGLAEGMFSGRLIRKLRRLESEARESRRAPGSEGSGESGSAGR